MSDYTPQAPQDFESESDFNSEMAYTGPAPMSGMAVAGFVSSVVICCPVLSPLLGFILSAVGIVQTRQGRRRGRGLAIAGLVISLLVSLPISTWGIAAVMNVFTGQFTIMRAVGKLDGGDVNGAVAMIYKSASDDFKSEVSEKQLADWLSAQCRARGGIQSVTFSPQQNQPEQMGSNRLVWSFPVQFPESVADFSLEATFDWLGRWIIMDVSLDEASVKDTVATPSAPTADPTGDGDAAQQEDTD